MSDFLNQTVGDFLVVCSMGILDEKALQSEYWQSAKGFVYENETKQLRDLSYKQRDWLIKIKTGLLE